MSKRLEVDLCVIGAGSAGLSVAAGAAMLDRPVALIEQAEMGGDCLNTGCVPSKALLAAAKAAHAGAKAADFGIRYAAPEVDFAAVQRHVRGVIDHIAPVDSQDRFEGLGATVIREKARFRDPKTVLAGDTEITARRFVIATGSRAAAPPIPGLDQLPYLTNETLFQRSERPDHLLIIGGGPIGIEMAQAHRRLGSRVTLFDQGRILPRDDAELVDILRAHLIEEGIAIQEGARIARVEPDPAGGIAILFSREDGEERRVAGSDLLVAAGRQANVEGLGLDDANIAYTDRGVTVDAGLRSPSNRRAYAIGDVAGGPQFTHIAGYHAGLVIRSALFRLPAKVDYRAMPWITYSDPELAQIGLTEAAARDRYGDVEVLRWSFAENDRAIAERRSEGMIKLIARKSGKVLGASILGPHAGEHLQSWGLMIQKGLKLSDMAGMVVAYPSWGEINKRAAGAFYSPKLFADRTKTLVRWLAKLG